MTGIATAPKRGESGRQAGRMVYSLIADEIMAISRIVKEAADAGDLSDEHDEFMAAIDKFRDQVESGRVTLEDFRTLNAAMKRIHSTLEQHGLAHRVDSQVTALQLIAQPAARN